MNSIPSFFRKYWKQLLLMAVSTLVSFGFVELAYRFILSQKYRHEMAGFNHDLWLPMLDRPEVYRMKPGIHGSAKLPEKKEVGWDYTINREGFRGRDWGERKPGVTRVMVIGDSYTFGWAMSEREETYPRVIERLLNQDAPTTRVEVLNAAVPGYNTRQEYGLLCDLAARYQPDIVVVGFVMNDAEPMANMPMPPWVRYRFATFWTLERLEEAFNSRFFKKHPLFHTVENVNDFNCLHGFAPESPKWRDCRDALRSIGELCRRRQIKLLLCLLPDVHFGVGADYPWTPIHETVGGWAREFGIPAVDLLPGFKGAAADRYQIAGDGHPNAAAHRKMGEIIARRLRPAIASPQ